MRTRQKRSLIKGKDEIRKIIEVSGMKYVLIHNGIFDELYMQKSIEGITQVLNEETNKKEWQVTQTKFTELELITYVFLQFMMINKITLNYEEIAGYIGCSSKQLKVALKRLQHFKGKTNAQYSSYTDEVKIVEEREVSLISEKTHTAYNPKTKKNQKALHWYTNYIPNYKKVKKEGKEDLVPTNFFMITIEDFDLLTNETLTRNEFITYLFFLKSYKYGATDDKQMYWKLSTIAESLNYRLTETVQNHVEKILNVKVTDVPLLEEIRPKNYDLQILKGEEPSSKYIPRYNSLKTSEMNSEKVEVSSVNKEMSFNKVEMSFRNEEIDLLNEEMSFLNE